eukprot:CAMPEP_0119053678 /NCGR_PEP_ID=MMETSP1177-20130426/74576_1 /TAXON_ID=2985 /ORGANISM="Ochromonas sp, Strain CCMP1899" /LENGTH=801 /DNA_ID=CAMNT_0007033687 /DNA_START=197 /DNA_END=2600 /DNA_ORIENTATION=+
MISKQQEYLLNRHHDQFLAMGLPLNLHSIACEKIISQCFDAGSYFQFQEQEEEDEDEDEEMIEEIEEGTEKTIDNSAQESDSEEKRDIEIDDTVSESEGLKNAVATKYSLGAASDMKNRETVLLIDHMWTTTFPQSRDHLKNIPGLCDRVESILGIEITNTDELRIRVDKLWQVIWGHLCCYLLPVDDYTRWFLMDEVGLSITHSCAPNVRCCPLLVDLGNGETFALSLLWPIKDILEGDIITRDYLPNVHINDPTRKLRLLAFNSHNTDEINLNLNINQNTNENIPDNLKVNIYPTPEPGEWDQTQTNLGHNVKDKTILKVFCDRSDHLNPSLMIPSDRIRLVSTPSEADVLYLIDHIINDESEHKNEIKNENKNNNENENVFDDINEDKEYVKKGKMSSQFCWGGMVVSKEHLKRTMCRAYKNDNISFLPVTYDLSYPNELENFINDYNYRKKMVEKLKNENFKKDLGLNINDNSGIKNTLKNDVEIPGSNKEILKNDNIWIMKRYRGRQSMDYPITDNLSCALRHVESAPRLASKYISAPALFRGRKFDLRYYVIVLSLIPLRIYRHQMFVIRVANHLYTTSDLEQFQKHFTVMNFIDNSSCPIDDYHYDLEQFQKHFTVMNFIDNSSCPIDDSVRAIRGQGGRENPSDSEFIEVFNDEYKTNTVNSSSSDKINHSWNNGSSQGNDSEDIPIDKNNIWQSIVQPAIDGVLKGIFEGVGMVFDQEPPHPSGQKLHPNAGWSLNQPNECPARAMFGIDVILSEDNQPKVLEVQWAPDCAQPVDQNPSFWNEILGGLYLEE